MNHTLKAGKNEQGIVSLIVAMVMMMVISILVIGFARLSQREARQALDNQLSVQAYYAAETGINDGVKSIQQFIEGAPGASLPTANTCYNGTTPLPAAAGTNYQLPLDSAGVVTYSCVFVNSAVDNLQYTPLQQKQPKAFPLRDKSDGVINSVTFSWEDSVYHGGTVSGCNSITASPQPTLPPVLPPACQIGMLEVNIVPTDMAGQQPNRDFLNTNDFRVFFVPSDTGGGTVGYDPANTGAVVAANCTSGTPYKCTATINGLSTTQYYVRLGTVYRDSNVTVNAVTSAGAAKLVGAQAVIDATGVANDVLHRMQVRVPLSPNAALAGIFGNICKRFMVVPNVSAQLDPAYSNAAIYPQCQLN